jgi:LEA14-like dessication related protein
MLPTAPADQRLTRQTPQQPKLALPCGSTTLHLQHIEITTMHIPADLLGKGLSRIFAIGLLAALSACSSLSQRDPLQVNLAGIQPLPGEGMELRFAVQLRIQNPNTDAIDYNGIALDLAINDQPLASGVSAQSGQIPRFGEVVISVPVTISAFSVMRQAWSAASYTSTNGMPYSLQGKLASGLLGSEHFTDSGTLNWPKGYAR